MKLCNFEVLLLIFLGKNECTDSFVRYDTKEDVLRRHLAGHFHVTVLGV